jgi:hypothetical protein
MEHVEPYAAKSFHVIIRETGVEKPLNLILTILERPRQVHCKYIKKMAPSLEVCAKTC